MTEQRNALANLLPRAGRTRRSRRLMADPKAVLKEYGLDVPDNLDVKVVENADDCVHLTLPAPPAGFLDLSCDELRTAAAAGLMAERGPVRFTRGPADY